ncbi:ribbon-helix-helix domain-containing protein [Heyndrickxia oleronia]|uniref:ribbon-helix-helix domain-containing protein n=1 Tax=Heyndrickxia oleronia TaxID=38875 RepID=UPI001C0F35F5|nr:ribbon-helix-helix domain-containing protein [Heyndrickxia oleronia]MBU5214395.1 ribbon-helix-helix domain-containing protein [Heyndrickxia oleronia]
MAHIRKDSSKPSTTVSFDVSLLEAIDDYRFENRKNNRSAAIAELIQLGFKYLEQSDNQRMLS